MYFLSPIGNENQKQFTKCFIQENHRYRYFSKVEKPDKATISRELLDLLNFLSKVVRFDSLGTKKIQILSPTPFRPTDGSFRFRTKLTHFGFGELFGYFVLTSGIFCIHREA